MFIASAEFHSFYINTRVVIDNNDKNIFKPGLIFPNGFIMRPLGNTILVNLFTQEHKHFWPVIGCGNIILLMNLM